VLVVELDKKSSFRLVRWLLLLLEAHERRPPCRPPTIWRASLHLCYLSERASVRRRITAHQPLQISLSIYTCLRYYLYKYFSSFTSSFIMYHCLVFLSTVYSYFLRVEGRTHLRGCQPSGVWREESLLLQADYLSTPLLPPYKMHQFLYMRVWIFFFKFKIV